MKKFIVSREILSLVLGILSVYLFATNNIDDAIYALVTAIWVEPRE